MKTLKLATSLPWILMHANGPESTNLNFLRVLCGSMADLHPDWQHLPPRGPWKQWEATSLCGSQPPMRSPSLFSHCHFRISTHSFSIPLSPPLYRSTLSLYSFSHFSSLFLMRETAYKVQWFSADSVWSPDTNTVSDCVSTNHWYKLLAFTNNFFYFKQSIFESCPALVLAWSETFSIALSDQSEAANGELPFRGMVLSALASYGVVNWIVKQI